MSMENIFRGIGEDWLSESAFSPAQRFRQYAQQTTAPGSDLRDAFYGLQSPLTQQYYLGGMGGTPRFGTSGAYGGSFGDFLRNYTGEAPGTTYPTGMNMRDLASRIAAISQMPEISYAPPGERGDPREMSFSDYVGTLPQAGTAAPGDLTREQANLFRQIYATEADAEENRRQLANLLALQRPGGEGIYGGVVGRALSGSINELYNQYMSQNPMGNFLQYYLGRTAPPVFGDDDGRRPVTSPVSPVTPGVPVSPSPMITAPLVEDRSRLTGGTFQPPAPVSIPNHPAFYQAPAPAGTPQAEYLARYR